MLGTWPFSFYDSSAILLTIFAISHRAPKATQITSVSPKVSLAWWMLPTMTQFRIEATAYVLPPPGHPSLSSFPADRLSPGAEGAKFDWDSERIRVWRKMSPDLRASFVRPVPGTSLKGTEIKPESFPTSLPTDLEAKTDEEKRLIAIGELDSLVVRFFGGAQSLTLPVVLRSALKHRFDRSCAVSSRHVRLSSVVRALRSVLQVSSLCAGSSWVRSLTDERSGSSWMASGVRRR